MNESGRPRSVYAIVAVLLIAGPALFWGWVRQWDRVAPGEPASEPNSWIAAQSDSRMQAAAAFKPLMDVQILTDAQPRESLAGMPVELDRLAVRSVSGSTGFWVSQVRTPSVFAAFAPNTKPAALHPGQAVSLRGTARFLADSTAIASQWPGLPQDDLERLQKQRVWIEATEISVDGTFD